jgi:hypothetical protein
LQQRCAPLQQRCAALQQSHRVCDAVQHACRHGLLAARRPEARVRGGNAGRPHGPVCCVATWCAPMQHGVLRCNMLSCVVTRCAMLQRGVLRCNR